MAEKYAETSTFKPSRIKTANQRDLSSFDITMCKKKSDESDKTDIPIY